MTMAMAMATMLLHYPVFSGKPIGSDKKYSPLRTCHEGALSCIPTSTCNRMRLRELLLLGTSSSWIKSSPTEMSMPSETVQEAEPASDSTYRFSPTATAKLVAVVEDNAVSPLGGATWHEVMKHMVKRIRWVDEGFEMVVFTDKLLKTGILTGAFHAAVSEANIVVIIGIRDRESVNWLLKHTRGVATKVCFDSATELETWLGGVKVLPLDPLEKVRSIIPGSKLNKGLKVLDTITNAWSRESSDNVYFVLLVLIDSYVSPVKLLKNLRATNLSSIQCMSKNCGKQILACLLDPTCREALNCLTNCAPNDQVCSYRCIVSYETPVLEAFSLCVLQKHNCLGLTAEIQMQPNVEPMKSFRGETLTHSLAEDLFIGWLGKLDWSWRVVAGQNAAYDQFPCQYQLFYRGKSKGSMWYDPVFKVQKLEGEAVWRRRHYRVKRGSIPGTFYFTVLDNGVVSKEFWRIVDVTDDLSWGLFYYSGAAEAAGQSYTGAVLVSPDGLWPNQSESERLNRALERSGIKIWEMYSVNNDCCEGMPLTIPEGSKLQENIV